MFKKLIKKLLSKYSFSHRIAANVEAMEAEHQLRIRQIMNGTA